MNYIKQVNTFYKLLSNNPLSPNAQCLYFYLLNKNNELAWEKRFTVTNLIIMGFTGLSESSLKRARNELKQKEYIDYIKRNGNNAGIYSIRELDVQYDRQSELQTDRQSDRQVDDKVTTLNKQNKTKEYIDHFELIWKEYPNKQGKSKAIEYYLQWIKGRKMGGITRKLTDKQMWYAVKKYRKECEDKQTEEKYIKHGDTFFSKAILDYLEEEDEQVSGD